MRGDDVPRTTLPPSRVEVLMPPLLTKTGNVGKMNAREERQRAMIASQKIREIRAVGSENKALSEGAEIPRSDRSIRSFIIQLASKGQIS